MTKVNIWNEENDEALKNDRLRDKSWTDKENRWKTDINANVFNFMYCIVY